MDGGRSWLQDRVKRLVEVSETNEPEGAIEVGQIAGRESGAWNSVLGAPLRAAL